MPRITRATSLIAALSLIAMACSGGDDEAATTTTTTAAASTTAATTTTAAPNTTVAATTTAATIGPSVTLTVEMTAGADIEETVQGFYSWLGDRSADVPNMPAGLVEFLGAVRPTADATIPATSVQKNLGEAQRVGVVTAEDDVLLLVDEGEGWRVVGAKLPRYGAGAWYGNPIRHVLVIGTDARPGQDQETFRADSIHILSSNATRGAGSIIGFPRDTYIEWEGRADKFTNMNVFFGPAAMVEMAADKSGLPVEGYLVTGFLGFEQMVNDFGGVMVNVPFAMNDPKSKAVLSAGLQRLWGANALAFTRNRSIGGGDFTRSLHHGLVILGGLAGTLELDITVLPDLLDVLDDHTWTNLSLEDLVTVAASSFELDVESVGNVVLPGQVVTRAGASVVDLLESAEDIFRDADDGVLDDIDDE